MSFSKVIIMSE